MRLLPSFVVKSSWPLATLTTLFVVALVLGPEIVGDRATRSNLAMAQLGPSWSHWLGTDNFGRDVLARTIAAARPSIGLAGLSVALAAVIGYPFGAVIPLLGKRAQTAAVWTLNQFQVFPPILLAMFLVGIIGPGGVGIVLPLTLAFAPSFARVGHALSASISSSDYVSASRMAGIGRGRLVKRHVLPNMAETVVVQLADALGQALVTLGSLSFLGLGVQPPGFDWGRMLAEGLDAIYTSPLLALAPATAITLSGIMFALLGEAFLRRLNPILRADSATPSDPPDVVPAEARVPADSRTTAGAVGVQAPGPPRDQERLVLELRGLTVEFPADASTRYVVKDVDLDICEGEIVGLVGESGSGKTLTAMSIAGLVPHPGSATASTFVFDHEKRTMGRAGQESLAQLGTRVGVVFQDPMSSLNPALKVHTQMTEAVIAHDGMSPSDARRRAHDRLVAVGIKNPDVVLDDHPHELSGGMRQRVMIAMGLMGTPRLIIADEPTTALDVSVQAQTVDLLRQVNQDFGTAILFISHDLALVSELCARIVVMYAGRIVEQGSRDEIISSPRHPYTRALLEVVPDITHPVDQRLHTIEGRPPDRASTGSCAFVARCTMAIDTCSKEVPPLVRDETQREVACWVAAPVPVDAATGVRS